MDKWELLQLKVCTQTHGRMLIQIPTNELCSSAMDIYSLITIRWDTVSLLSQVNCQFIAWCLISEYSRSNLRICIRPSLLTTEGTNLRHVLSDSSYSTFLHSTPNRVPSYSTCAWESQRGNTIYNWRGLNCWYVEPSSVEEAMGWLSRIPAIRTLISPIIGGAIYNRYRVLVSLRTYVR